MTCPAISCHMFHVHMSHVMHHHAHVHVMISSRTVFCLQHNPQNPSCQRMGDIKDKRAIVLQKARGYNCDSFNFLGMPETLRRCIHFPLTLIHLREPLRTTESEAPGTDFGFLHTRYFKALADPQSTVGFGMVWPQWPSHTNFRARCDPCRPRCGFMA